ncbi:MAG TPA: lipopolysaccharide heptosyltransferase II [Gemmatimonadales bacterium]|nr:lipopolysaccharide heptosyltransferase II [Gemmatimonadales bacterium]
MPSDPRILAVRFSSIGDVLLITPLLRALRARHPGATLTALTKSSFAPLLADNPHLSDVLTLDPHDSIAVMARELRLRNYTHLLDLHGSLRSRVLRLLVPGRWSGFDARRRQRRALIRYKRNLYRDILPVPERYFEAARDLDVTPDEAPAEMHLHPSATETAARWLSENGLNGDRRLLVVAPGAAHATKRWPQEHWRKLVESVTHSGTKVAVIGGAEDRAICAGIAAAGNGSAASGAGELGLQESGAVLARATVAVTGDTGVMHMATAIGTPVVALFGPTVEAFGFFPYRARATVLQRDLGCRPCSAKGTPRCPLVHHRCMREISPDEVEVALTELAS